MACCNDSILHVLGKKIGWAVAICTKRTTHLTLASIPSLLHNPLSPRLASLSLLPFPTSIPLNYICGTCMHACSGPKKTCMGIYITTPSCTYGFWLHSITRDYRDNLHSYTPSMHVTLHTGTFLRHSKFAGGPSGELFLALVMFSNEMRIIMVKLNHGCC